ncbi:NAD-dependent epimerase/dehydratase family protein [Algibacter mikhailovii]|uniref:NAD-dependent epimerase/dehydratase family protein n=1 Tax=Algibacter mikhailovii TaxID=425498 RepID=UPI0024945BBA|nr:NAD-dependent epimerase/dehydratase family protein [Algibacter mikhailovii]
MDNSRRNFIKNGMILGLAPIINTNPIHSFVNFYNTSETLKILILGGTSFLGPHQIAYALERGHEVSIFSRGKTAPKIHTEHFQKVEHLIGDREDNLEALKNRTWDLVIDNSGRKTKWTEDTAKLLVNNVGYYMYTSSVSVYYPYTGNDFSEDRAVVTEIPEDATDEEKPTYAYGVMKANSEQAAINIFGSDRSIIVRPHLIVGPGDPTDRFPYWIARLEKGGDFIIPGKSDEVIQYIDVRDLAEWMIRLAENKASGIYNGAGPNFEMTTNAFVYGMHANYNSPINYIQIDDIDFLRDNNIFAIQPWVIQLPEYAGMSRIEIKKAVQSGLQFRTLSETVEATKLWWYSSAVAAERRDNILTSERALMPREKEIIAKWKNSNPK